MEETAAGSSDGRRRGRSGEAKAEAAAVPGYLRPSAGSCHHVCKYGGAHTFEEREPRRAAQTRPRKQPPPPAPEISDRSTKPATATALAKLRSASSRRRVGDLTKTDKTSKKSAAAAVDDTGKKDAGAVVWKDIVAYESSPQPPGKITIAAGDVKDVSVTKGKKSIKPSHGKAQIVSEQTDDDVAANKKPADGSLKKKKLIKSVGSKLTGKASSPELKSGETTASPSDKNKMKMIKSRTKSVKPPKPKKILVEIHQEMAQRDSSSSSAAAATSDMKEEKAHHALVQEENSGRAPTAAHRRAKSMSITSSSKSVRFPFTRQASRRSTSFKVIRSKSSRAAAAAPPEEDDKPAPATRLRFFRRGDAGGGSSSSGGNGVQLRIRSLRRRGSSIGGGGTGTAAGFVVPAVALRHQKTLEKKKSRRLYNSVIEETAGKLAKARKSRVKALVGAFESLIAKIGK